MLRYPASLSDSGINRPPIPAIRKSGRFNPGFPGRFIPVWVADLSRFPWPIYPGIGGRFIPEYAPASARRAFPKGAPRLWGDRSGERSRAERTQFQDSRTDILCLPQDFIDLVDVTPMHVSCQGKR